MRRLTDRREQITKETRGDCQRDTRRLKRYEEVIGETKGCPGDEKMSAQFHNVRTVAGKCNTGGQ